jgi:hypothetical protein
MSCALSITFAWQGRARQRDRHDDVEAGQGHRGARPGLLHGSHGKTRYAWVDSMMSPTAKDTLTIIDKRTLEPVASVR